MNSKSDLTDIRPAFLLLSEDTPKGQVRAVTLDGGLITVGAGAGTGKTWVLSARYARLLLTRECLPQNILTLTFTEAAAREMQDRIRRRVFEALDRTSGNPDERKAFRHEIQSGFDEAWISTIHSFASRLIRESGLSLDVDPRSAVVGEAQEEAFWGALESALENLDFSPLVSSCGKTLRETAALLEGDATLSAALEKWGASALRGLAHDVTELHASLGNDWETLLAWAGDAERAGALRLDRQAETASQSIQALLKPRWAKAWDLWSDIFTELRREILGSRDKALEKTDAKRVNPVLPLAEIMEKWEGHAPAPEVQRLFYAELCSRLSSDNSKLFKAIAERLGLSASKWRDAQAPWDALSAFPANFPFSEAEQRLRAALLRLSALAWAAWDETKRRKGLLSFSDMIRFAAQTIRGDLRVKGFKHVLIDEFQDTDPLQDSMIRALSDKESARLFLVGDPKQAIYRFRHADLTLFADYVLQSQASGSDVALDVNFRTRGALMERINSLFAHIWKNGLGSGKRMEDLKFIPLSPASPPPGRELSDIPPFTLLLSVRKGRQDNARERLDRALARRFARFVEEGRTVWDKEENRLRPARWCDFAVLTPTRGEYGTLEAVFEEEGVPASFEGSKSYFSRGEVVDVINVLRAAAFPDDETALAGWLASPFSGVPQREVQSCLEHTPAGLLRDALAERLPGAAGRLAYLRWLGGLKGSSAVLSHLLEDRRWLSVFSPALRPRVAANVNRAVAIARQYETGVSPSLAGCAQWLDTALRAEKSIEEPDWMDENADVVRVMTIHASKGLEFPVVAVMRAERGVRPRFPSTLAASKTMGAVVSGLPDMMKEEENGEEEREPRSLQWERALSAQDELEESARLFYVAETRAQDSLILCGTVNEDAKGEKGVKSDSWLSWTLEWLSEEREGWDWKDLRPPVVLADAEEGRRRSGSARGDPPPSPAPLELPDPSLVLSSFSATSFALFEWCPYAWRRRHRQGLDLKWEIPDDADATGGSKLGSLAHWILARWNLREETLGQWMETNPRRFPTALRETWRDAKKRETLREWLSAFARSDEGRGMADAVSDNPRSLWRESAFGVTVPWNGGAKAVRLAGAVDALWREGGFWRVRDYKITLSDNAPAELYRAQLTFYALAVKLLAGRRDDIPFEGVDVALIFLREHGRLGDMRAFSRERDWTETQNQITAAAVAAAQGPWIPKREHCRRCPWRAGCPGKG